MSRKYKKIYAFISRFINEIQFKIIVKKLEKHDLMADVDDQRFHHFSSK